MSRNMDIVMCRRLQRQVDIVRRQYLRLAQNVGACALLPGRRFWLLFFWFPMNGMGAHGRSSLAAALYPTIKSAIAGICLATDIALPALRPNAPFSFGSGKFCSVGGDRYRTAYALDGRHNFTN